MKEFIPYGHQDLTPEDLAAVTEVLHSDWWTQGPKVAEFQSVVSGYCGAQYGVAVANATAALHVACLALGVGADDEVWTSPNTFTSSVNCARFCGAEVDFVDIDAKTYNMSVEQLKQKLAQAKQKNKLPKVVIPVHFAGQSCDMKAIYALSQEYGFKIIEDASHCIGGDYLDKKIGCCQYSDITVFSFHPVKIIATGEGGMALTNSEELAKKMQLYRTHGITRDPELMMKPAEGPWYYQMVDLGYNYRMSDILCALGVSQMQRVDQFVARRRELVQQYNELLKDLPVITPYQSTDGQPGWHLYVIQLGDAVKTRLEVFKALRAANIGVNVHYIPVHTQPYYESLGFKQGDFPVAENYYQHTITLPLYPGLTDEEQRYVVAQLKEALQ